MAEAEATKRKTRDRTQALHNIKTYVGYLKKKTKDDNEPWDTPGALDRSRTPHKEDREKRTSQSSSTPSKSKAEAKAGGAAKPPTPTALGAPQRRSATLTGTTTHPSPEASSSSSKRDLERSRSPRENKLSPVQERSSQGASVPARAPLQPVQPAAPNHPAPDCASLAQCPITSPSSSKSTVFDKTPIARPCDSGMEETGRKEEERGRNAKKRVQTPGFLRTSTPKTSQQKMQRELSLSPVGCREDHTESADDVSTD